MEIIIGYKWKLYYGSTLIEENDEVFDEEWQARQEGEEAIDYKIAEWKLNDAWHEWDHRDDFDVVIVDVTEDEDEYI